MERRSLLATYVVDLALDENDGNFAAGDLSLREAVLLSNAAADADVIEFAPTMLGKTIAVTSSEIPIREILTINGPGASQLTVSGSNTQRVFAVRPGATVEISGMTIRNGRADPGGAIQTEGALTLRNMTLTANTANGGTGGGAVYVGPGAGLTINNSTISNNKVTGTNSFGGGIYNAGGTISIVDTTITGNSAVNSGGGIWNNLGTLTITNSTLSGNTAISAGAIYVNGGSLTMTNSTVSGNSSANNGGGIFFGADGTLTNVTITGNRADSDDSGFGSGGGIGRGAGSVVVRNTIVAGNFVGSGTTADDVSGSLAPSSAFNLIGGDPHVGLLANNGGSTFTHALLAGSPAIDAGSNTGAPTTDQRGVVRPRDGNGDGLSITDIGAYELEPPNSPPVAEAGGPYAIDSGTALVVDASQSFDPDAAAGDHIASFEWDLDNNGTFESSAAGAVHTFAWNTLADLGVGNTPGTTTIRLRVADSFGATAVDTASLTIYDNRPFAAFTVSPNPAACNEPLAFNATASSHGRPDRQIVSYSWNFGDGTAYTETAASAADGAFDGRTTHSYSLFADYTATLTVTDNNVPAKSASAIVVVHVNQGNHAPVARAGGPYTADLDAGLTLDGSASSDPDEACGDSIVSYQWNIGPFLSRTGVRPSLTASEVASLGLGTFSVSLTVNDEFGVANTNTTTLTIYDNRPFARLVVTPNPAACNEPLAFNATPSSHGRPDRAIVSYSWDFGDGTSYTEMLGNAPDGAFDGRTTHAYGRFGSYMVNLAVTDNNNPARADAESLVVNVNQGNHPPIAVAGGPYVARVGEIVTLDGSRSSDPDVACGDSIVAYEWDLDNDGVFSGAIVNPTGVVVTQQGATPLDVSTSSPTFQYRNENWDFGGSQTVRLRVNDMFGRYQSDPYAETTIRLFNNLLPVLEAIDRDDAIELDESAIALPSTPAFIFDLSGTDLDSDQTLSFSLVAPTVCPPGVTAYDPNDPTHTSMLRIEVLTDTATPGTPPDGASSATGTLRIQPGPNSAGTWCFGVRVSDNAGGHEATNTRPVLLTVHRAAPTIASFTPNTGTVGTLVTINGTDLSPVTDVKFGGTSITDPVEVLSASSIRVAVPLGAATGPITVTTPAGTATSAVFKVLPKINSFSPTSALVGETVTILGTNFTGATAVKFGAVLAPVVSNTYSEIVAQVPATAPDTSKISVQTADGVAISVQDFVVIKAPTISSFTPAAGTVGTLVTISGTNLSSVTDVMFGNVSVTNPIQIVSAGSIKVTVPMGAVTGKISVTNRAGTALSVGNFNVAPKINSFTPTSGLAGTMVTIVGSNFFGATEVRFGTVSAAFAVDSYSQITAQVPTTPPVSTRISVTTGDGVAISDGPFDVLPSPPVITGNSVVQAGLSIDLRGDSSASQFRYHQWTWTNSAGATVTIERDTAGSGFVSQVVFSAAGFSGVETRTITLQACSTGYGIGTCVTTTRTITITPNRAPVAHAGGPYVLEGGHDLTVNAGASFDPGNQFDVITGAGPGAPGGHVKVFDGSTNAELRSFFAYPGLDAGVRVAAGDVNGDGFADIITGAGPGAGPHVKVFDGRSNIEIMSFFAYGPTFSGGIFVAAGDVNGDGRADIVTGADEGLLGGHVKVFDGRTGGELSSFFAYPGFSGGVRVAAGDVNGDGRADIITGAGPGAGPHVKVFDGRTNAELMSFFAYGPSLTGGIFVAAGDLDGDGRADIVTGADSGADGGHVKVFSARTGAELRSFLAYPGFSGGVRVAAGDVNGDGFADIVTGAGPGAGPHVKVFDGRSNAELSSFFAYGPTFSGGVYVAAGDVNGDRIVKYDWDLDNDGLYEGLETSPSGAVHTFLWDSVADLGVGTHSITLRVTDSTGRTGFDDTTLTIVDTTPPETFIDHAPPVLIGTREATFEVHGSDLVTPANDLRFEYSLDGAPFRRMSTASTTLRDLSDGEHTFVVHAVDKAGNADPSPAEYRWRVDTMPPDTTITSAPPAATNSTTVQFRFEATIAGATFECKLDDEAFRSIPENSIEYVGLSEGQHTFTVRAKSAAGTPDPTPATYTWVVDRTPPDTTITSGPPQSTSDRTVVFTFEAHDALTNIARVECSLDDGPFIVVSTNSIQFGGLSTGPHTFKVFATDSAGNADPSPAEYPFTVTAIAPDTAITSCPPSLTNSRKALITFEATGAGGQPVTFLWSLNGGPFQSTTESSVLLTGLDDGNHEFTVKAVAGGIEDPSPATCTFEVDATPPDTTITSPTPDSSSTNAEFTFAGSDASGHGVTFQCSLDDGPLEAVAATGKNYAGLSLGSHKFKVFAVDLAGNKDETPAEVTWTIDTTPPDTTITSAPPELTNSNTAQFRFEATKQGATFQCSLDNEAFAAAPGNTISYADLQEGQHTFHVRAVLGGVEDPTPAEYTWVVDRTGPDTTITSGPTPADTAPSDVTFTFTSSEPASTFTCQLDDGPIEIVIGDSKRYTQLADGPHTFTVVAVDRAGNKDETPATRMFTVDATGPVIDIAPPSGIYRPGTTYSWSAADAISGILETTFTIDGVVKPAANPQPSLPMLPGTHTVVVTAIDRAGNPSTESRTYTVTGAAVVAGHLVVVGSDFDDSIDIRAVSLGLNVVMNGTSLGLFPASVQKVIAYGLAGNDTIRGETLRHPLRFDGGDGDDILVGGRANDILLGGRGNDRLTAGLGRDFLIGGLGRDNVSGAGSILVNGTTAYDDDTEALELILQAWENPGLSPAARMAQIQSGLGSTGIHLDTAAARRTVFDDGDADTLVGQLGLEWFFAELGQDTVVRLARPRPPINPGR